jgi:hypothetical protein
LKNATNKPPAKAPPIVYTKPEPEQTASCEGEDAQDDDDSIGEMK